MKNLLTALALFAVMTGAAAAQDGMSLTLGKMKVSGESYFRLPVALKNDQTAAIQRAKLECGFFLRGELVATDDAYVENIAPGATGYQELLVPNRGDLPDRTDCRIVKAR